MNNIFESTARQLEEFGGIREKVAPKDKWHIVISEGESCDLHMIVADKETKIPYLDSIICIGIGKKDKLKTEKLKFLEAGLKAINNEV